MASHALEALGRRLEDRSLLVGVIGLGYVGLPLALAFLDCRVRVLGFDIDPVKCATLQAGDSYLRHLDTGGLKAGLAAGLFEATADFSRLVEPDALLICVPTPLGKNREPDLQYVVGTGRAVGSRLRAGQLVCLESTTFPGTTVEVLQPLLAAGGLAAGKDYALAYSPERVDPGNRSFNLRQIPKLVAGADSLSAKLARDLYGLAFERVVEVSSPGVAEMAKLLENIFRSVNIALVNELKLLALRMGIDIWEVIAAAATKPFGFMPFQPGPGLGGHCIPVDPFYLAFKAREYDLPAKFIELAGEINTAMPAFVVERVTEALNRHGRALNGAQVLVLGVAYKKDIDDCRESPSFKLMALLEAKGAHLAYNDPHVPRLVPVRNYDFTMASTDLSAENLAGADCVLLATDHTAYDYDFILRHARLIVDTRNAFAGRVGAAGKVVAA